VYTAGEAHLESLQGIQKIRPARASGASREGDPVFTDRGGRAEVGSPQRSEVEISPEARARQAQVRRSAVNAAGALPARPADAAELRTRATDPVRSQPPAAASRDSRPETPAQEPAPVLAVRIGVAPIGQIGDGPQRPNGAEAVLRERALLRDLGQVLSLPRAEGRELELPARSGKSDSGDADESDERSEARDRARSASSSREEVVLAGAGSEREAPRAEATRPRPPAPAARGGFAARDVRVPRPAPEPTRRADDKRRAAEERRSEPSSEPRLREVAAVIGSSGSGAVRDPNETAQQLPLPGSGTQDEDASRIAEQVATQFGSVEAQAADELVARFLGNLPGSGKDPGPEPRPRQTFE
jgi:hypothetical protein